MHLMLLTSMKGITASLIWAVRYFRSYLLGHPCTIYTDHAACLSILNTTKPSGKLARWALTIQEMDLTIKHKLGKKNTNADALSRCPADVMTNSTIVEVTVTDDQCLMTLDQLRDSQLEDTELAVMMLYLREGILPDDDKQSRKIVLESKNFELVEGTLYHENPAFLDVGAL